MHWLKPESTRALLIAMTVAAVALSGVLALLLVARFAPVDVLRDWSISIPDREYVGGQPVTFVSKAVKVREAEGIAVRSLHCEASKNDDDHDYELDAKTVNRPVGVRKSSANDVTLPKVKDAPRRCKLLISVKYDLYPYLREPFFEYAQTDYFTVIDAPVTAEQSTSSATSPLTVSSQPQTSAHQEVPVPPQQPAQNQTAPSPQQTLNTQSSAPIPAPGITEQILTPVSHLLEFLL